MTSGSKKLSFVDDYTRLNEYLLLISPDGRLRSRLVSRKKEFTATYGNDDAERSLPHLTLANFILSDNNQDKIIKPLKDVASKSNKIGIELENFKWFKEHTIYVDVKYKTDMKQLVRKITNAIKRFIKADNNYPPHFILNPHLTLCKGLTSEQHKKSSLEYGALKFSDKFTAAEMILLKRSVITAERYREVGRFRLGGPESNNRTIQLTLF
jgi:2'-5' RNA ligase